MVTVQRDETAPEGPAQADLADGAPGDSLGYHPFPKPWLQPSVSPAASCVPTQPHHQLLTAPSSAKSLPLSTSKDTRLRGHRSVPSPATGHPRKLVSPTLTPPCYRLDGCVPATLSHKPKPFVSSSPSQVTFFCHFSSPSLGFEVCVDFAVG